MRVLQVVHALPPSTFGGTELYTRDLAGALAAAGHETAVATPRGDDADVDGVDVIPLPEPEETGVQDDLGLPFGPVDPSIDARFARVLDRFEPDVVHLQHVKGLSAALPALCADRDVPCLGTLHDFWTICHREQLARPDGRRCSGPETVEKCTDCLLASDDGPRSAVGADRGPVDQFDPGTAPDVRRHYGAAVELRRTQLRRALSATDRLIAPSAFLRDVFVEHGVPPDSIVHRRNGIEVDRFEDSGFDPRSPLRVGYAGRIAPEKGVHLLLDAFADVDGDASLSVFGRFDPAREEYHAHLADVADDVGGDRVRFRGRYDDRSEPYRELDVLVLPSTWYENSPLVIQEAFASDVPVVAGDVGGMEELVTDGRDGLTFAVGDQSALTSALQRLADDPGLVRRLRDGVRAPKRLREHVEELVDLYERCATHETDSAVATGEP